MFGLFKNISPKNLIDMAKSAKIEVVYENGNYVMFLVFIGSRGRDISRIIKSDFSVAKEIIRVVDNRIMSNQFDDPMSWDEHRTFMGWVPNMKAKRALVSSDNQPVFSWEVG